MSRLLLEIDERSYRCRNATAFVPTPALLVTRWVILFLLPWSVLTFTTYARRWFAPDYARLPEGAFRF
jgi:hypothetical protein